MKQFGKCSSLQLIVLITALLAMCNSSAVPAKEVEAVSAQSSSEYTKTELQELNSCNDTCEAKCIAEPSDKIQSCIDLCYN